MKNIHAFLFMYSALVLSTVFALSLFDEMRIDAYTILFIVEFFIASEVTSPLTPEQSHRKDSIGIVLLVIFIGIVLRRMIEILR
jgi:hypothetical protein